MFLLPVHIWSWLGFWSLLPMYFGWNGSRFAQWFSSYLLIVDPLCPWICAKAKTYRLRRFAMDRMSKKLLIWQSRKWHGARSLPSLGRKAGPPMSWQLSISQGPCLSLVQRERETSPVSPKAFQKNKLCKNVLSICWAWIVFNVGYYVIVCFVLFCVFEIPVIWRLEGTEWKVVKGQETRVAEGPATGDWPVEGLADGLRGTFI